MTLLKATLSSPILRLPCKSSTVTPSDCRAPRRLEQYCEPTLYCLSCAHRFGRARSLPHGRCPDMLTLMPTRLRSSHPVELLPEWPFFAVYSFVFYSLVCALSHRRVNCKGGIFCSSIETEKISGGAALFPGTLGRIKGTERGVVLPGVLACTIKHIAPQIKDFVPPTLSLAFNKGQI